MSVLQLRSSQYSTLDMEDSAHSGLDGAETKGSQTPLGREVPVAPGALVMRHRSSKSSPHKSVDRCIETLQSGHLLSEDDIKFVCQKLVEVLLNEPNIRPVSTPVTLVGDVHG